MDNLTPLYQEAERLLKVANDLNKSFLLFGKPTEAEVKAAIEAAENAFKAARADLKQRNAEQCILSLESVFYTLLPCLLILLFADMYKNKNTL